MEIKGSNNITSALAAQSVTGRLNRVRIDNISREDHKQAARSADPKREPPKTQASHLTMEEFIDSQPLPSIGIETKHIFDPTNNKTNHALHAYVSQQNLPSKEERELISQLLGVDYYA